MFFEEATDETDFEIRFQDQIECTKKVLKVKEVNQPRKDGFMFETLLSISFFFSIHFVFFCCTTFEFTNIEKFCIPLD